MILLQVEHVTKRYRRGSRVALEDVSMEIHEGEMVVVWGERKSGRSTLLRVAAGLVRPDTGVVRLDGRELSVPCKGGLGWRIGYCRRESARNCGSTVLEQLIVGQLGRRVRPSAAFAGAWRALERVEARSYAELTSGELKPDEAVRIAIARALTGDPRLLVIDEPALGVDLLKRDDILKLLRSLADEGIAILSSTSEGTGVLGADRVLVLDEGRLDGNVAPDLAPVTDLDRHRQARS
jgi:ABC-type sugar transport system ATPase subunit